MNASLESLPGRLGQICRGEVEMPPGYREEVLRNLHRTKRIDDAALIAAGIDPEKPPSVIERAKSLGRAVGRTVKAVVTGQQAITPPGELEARKAACNSCDKSDAGWCRKCGCVLAAKQKLATETCPLGRWPKTP